MDNPETLATLYTQGTRWKQTRIHYKYLDQNLTKSERVEDTFVRSLKSERTDNTKTKYEKNPNNGPQN
jgi:hypothetical protein